MKTTLRTVFLAATLGGVASGLAQTKPSYSELTRHSDAPGSSGAKIDFAETVFEFGKIISGEVVKHAFIFTNTGAAALEIKDVRLGCGCTTAGIWDKLVEPGKTGIIPLQFNSTNYSGAVTKSAIVTCNDPAKTNVVLQITGEIWKPIDVTPAMAVFHLASDLETNETRVVHIVNNLDEPIELSDLRCTNHAFQVELKTVKPGREFDLQITTGPPFSSPQIIAPISLRTSSPKMPTIGVTAYLTLQEPVKIRPSQIVVPMGVLTAGFSSSLSIRNNGVRPLALSEPSVNVPGAEVRVKETLPGRLFSVMVNFAAGTKIEPDQKVEVTIKSNHPKMPVIKVPVLYQTNPVAVRAAPRSATAEVRRVPLKAGSSGATGE